jgi:hypothetical protein
MDCVTSASVVSPRGTKHSGTGTCMCEAPSKDRQMYFGRTVTRELTPLDKQMDRRARQLNKAFALRMTDEFGVREFARQHLGLPYNLLDRIGAQVLRR